jgi:two-component system OmpR family response regulator
MLRILAVDNEPSVLTSLRFVFDLPRYDLTPVKGGEEALVQLKKTSEPFDVIIVDQRMPHLTGSALVAAIRKQGVTSKIIVLSAHITEEIRRVYEQLDVHYIFEKPFDLTEFRTAVDAQGREFTKWKTAMKLRDLPPKKDPRSGRRSYFNRAPFTARAA